MAHQPDVVVAKNTDKKFTPHPEGQFAAVCVDVVDFGEKTEQFADKPERLVSKVGIVFRTGEVDPETGNLIDILKEFTVSMGEKANLRKFLEAWRGKSYSDEEAEQGAPLHKLVGQVALLTVEHKPSSKGRIYANINSVSGLPKVMHPAAPKPDGYTRPEYITARKKEYAEEAAKFRARIGAPAGKVDASFSDFPEEMAGDDDLPF